MSTPETPGATATPPPEPEKTKAKMTEYVILSANNIGDRNWQKEGTAKGHGAEGAIRAYLSLDGSQPDGCYVAVPLRSWQPLTPQVETQTKLKFS